MRLVSPQISDVSLGVCNHGDGGGSGGGGEGRLQSLTRGGGVEEMDFTPALTGTLHCQSLGRLTGSRRSPHTGTHAAVVTKGTLQVLGAIVENGQDRRTIRVELTMSSS